MSASMELIEEFARQAAATKRAEDAKHLAGVWEAAAKSAGGSRDAAEHRAATAEARVKELEGACKTLRDERADWMRCSANDGEVRKESARAQSALQEALAREAGLRSALEAVRATAEVDDIFSWLDIVDEALSASASPSDTGALIEAGRLAVELTEVGGDWWSWLDTGPARDIAARLHRACAAIIEKEQSNA